MSSPPPWPPEQTRSSRSTCEISRPTRWTGSKSTCCTRSSSCSRSGPWTSMQSVLPYSATRPDGSAHPRSAGGFRHRFPRLFGGGQRRHLLRSLRTRGSTVGSGVRSLHGVGRRLHDPRQDRGRHVAGLGPGEGNAQRQAGLPPRLEPFSAVGRAPHEWAIRDGGDRIWHADVPRAGSVLRRATELDPLLGRTNGPAPRVRHRRRRASAG